MLGIALIAMGEEIGAEMALRTFGHLVSMVWGVLGFAGGQPGVSRKHFLLGLWEHWSLYMFYKIGLKLSPSSLFLEVSLFTAFYDNLFLGVGRGGRR